MRVVAFGGAAKGDGAQLLAAGLASLGRGARRVQRVPAVRTCRTTRSATAGLPALVALVSGVVGVAVMIGGGRAFHGAATVGLLGVGHSVAYLVGAVALGIGLHRRTGAVWPHALVPAIVAITPFAVIVWWVGAEVEPQSRLLTALLVAGLSVFGRPRATCSCSGCCGANHSHCPGRGAHRRPRARRRRARAVMPAPRRRASVLGGLAVCAVAPTASAATAERRTGACESSSSRSRTCRGPTWPSSRCRTSTGSSGAPTSRALSTRAVHRQTTLADGYVTHRGGHTVGGGADDRRRRPDDRRAVRDDDRR